MLGADADLDAVTLAGGRRQSTGRVIWVPPWNSTVRPSAPVPTTVAGRRFMLGWPMKVATKRVAGWW